MSQVRVAKCCWDCPVATRAVCKEHCGARKAIDLGDVNATVPVGMAAFHRWMKEEKSSPEEA